jgi:hypothetical protein
MNTAEINGVQVRLKDKIRVEYNSPFIDSTELYIGTEVRNPRGAYTISENVLLSNEALKEMKFPHILAKKGRQFKFGRCAFRSNGVKVDTGEVELMNIERNFDSGSVKGDLSIVFSDTEFLDVIEGKTIRDLALCGVINVPKNPNNKTIWPFDVADGPGGYPIDFESGLGNPFYTGTGYPGSLDYWANLPYDDDALMGTNHFAQDVVANGHDYFCFPSFRIKRGDNWIIANYWDAINGKFLTTTICILILMIGRVYMRVYLKWPIELVSEILLFLAFTCIKL